MVFHVVQATQKWKLYRDRCRLTILALPHQTPARQIASLADHSRVWPKGEPARRLSCFLWVAFTCARRVAKSQHTIHLFLLICQPIKTFPSFCHTKVGLLLDLWIKWFRWQVQKWTFPEIDKYFAQHYYAISNSTIHEPQIGVHLAALL